MQASKLYAMSADAHSQALALADDHVRWAPGALAALAHREAAALTALTLEHDLAKARGAADAARALAGPASVKVCVQL